MFAKLVPPPSLPKKLLLRRRMITNTFCLYFVYARCSLVSLDTLPSLSMGLIRHCLQKINLCKKIFSKFPQFFSKFLQIIFRLSSSVFQNFLPNFWEFSQIHPFFRTFFSKDFLKFSSKFVHLSIMHLKYSERQTETLIDYTMGRRRTMLSKNGAASFLKITLVFRDRKSVPVHPHFFSLQE